MPRADFKSRSQLPQLLNDLGLLGVGVEVGVQRGVFGSHVRGAWNGKLYVGVDPWVPYNTEVTAEQHEQYRRDAIVHLDGTHKNYSLIRLPSLAGAKLFADGSLDWVFLDGDHDYPAVLDDIKAWLPKVKTGGVLAGHDFVPDGWHRNGDPVTGYATAEEAKIAHGHCGPFFVIKAVAEAFGDGAPDARQVFVTDPSEDDGWRSWMVIV